MRGRSFTDDGFDPKTLDVVLMIVLAVVAAMLLYTLWKYLRCSKETVGTIVDIEPLHGAGGSVRKRLTISFQTQTGPAEELTVLSRQAPIRRTTYKTEETVFRVCGARFLLR